MNIELFILDGHGKFIWPSFIFTFLSCFFLYQKTKMEFKKQKKIFLHEFKQLETIKIQIAKKKKMHKKFGSASFKLSQL